jgi:group I intron endonuclease
MKSGIYKITNKVTNKFYIGSAVDIKSRWSGHKRRLKANTHDNKHLQSAWNKDGIQNFLFEIVEICEREILIPTEQKYLDEYKCWDREIGYNIAKIAGNTTGCFHTEESKTLIKKNNKAGEEQTRKKMRDFWSNPENRKYQSKKRKEYLSRKENREKLKNSLTDYYKNNPEKKLFAEKNPSYGLKFRNKHVERIDPSTGEIKEYESIRDTAKDGFMSTTVGKVCRGQLKTHRGYYWKYKEE